MSRCGAVAARLTCCCSSDNIPVGGDANIDDVIFDASGKGYKALTNRLSADMNIFVELVSGQWYVTPRRRLKRAQRILRRAEQHEEEAVASGDVSQLAAAENLLGIAVQELVDAAKDLGKSVEQLRIVHGSRRCICFK